MKKILTIVGARPQFVKAAALSVHLRDHQSISEDLLHTGQHYDVNMSQVFFDQLKIPKPKYQLQAGAGSHGQQTGTMLEGIEKILLENHYDLVLVYGDTNSTLAGALAASKLHIPVAHVEAGLRSFNQKMPEEINRKLTDHCSEILFAPTATAVKNLNNEGLNQKTILVGDIMYDATLLFKSYSKKVEGLPAAFKLVTLHRAENVDSKEFLETVFSAFAKLSSANFVLPIHPRLKKNLEKFIINIPANVRIIPPVSYLEMLYLESTASAILTDSGGVQKEAFFSQVPCLTLRSETEWVETIDSGWNNLADLSSPHTLSEQISKLKRPNVTSRDNYFGTGDAALKIISEIEKF